MWDFLKILTTLLSNNNFLISNFACKSKVSVRFDLQFIHPSNRSHISIICQLRFAIQILYKCYTVLCCATSPLLMNIAMFKSIANGGIWGIKLIISTSVYLYLLFRIAWDWEVSTEFGVEIILKNIAVEEECSFFLLLTFKFSFIYINK